MEIHPFFGEEILRPIHWWNFQACYVRKTTGAFPDVVLGCPGSRSERINGDRINGLVIFNLLINRVFLGVKGYSLGL